MSDYFDELIGITGNQYASKVSEGMLGSVNEYIDTGSYILNALISGSIHKGLPSNKITAFAGESATGKTFFILGIVRQFLADNQLIPGGPHTQWHTRIVDAWVVSQKENEYIPVHTHYNQRESCKISGVLYLKVPEQINQSNNDIAIKGGKDGQLVFTGMGGADLFSTTVQYNVPPEAGWMYLFPSTLNHQVYPFKGAGERRGISFNIDVISVEQLNLIKQSVDAQNDNYKVKL